jgi:hypothetical protein
MLSSNAPNFSLKVIRFLAKKNIVEILFSY